MPKGDALWDILGGTLGELLGDALRLFDGNALGELLGESDSEELGEVEG